MKNGNLSNVVVLLAKCYYTKNTPNLYKIISNKIPRLNENVLNQALGMLGSIMSMHQVTRHFQSTVFRLYE